MFGEFVLGLRRRLKNRDDDSFVIFLFLGVFIKKFLYK